MVTRLAKMKAESIQIDEKIGNMASIPIIAADTIVCIDDHILGKPKDETDAIRMLELLSNKTHEVVTGYTVKLGMKEKVNSVITKVSFRELSLEQIKAYVKTKEPLDKAGSYGIQGFGASLIDQIQGSYSNVVGLPIKELLSSLQEISR
jgi:septum formation protein